MNNNILNDPLFSQQWHLNNTGQSGGTAGSDINLLDTWDTFTGKGVVVGVVDDGLQYNHPDLESQYRADLSYDFVDEDNDPNITSEAGTSSDAHGTAIAGIIAAKGNNEMGVSGVAPDASLAGLKLDFSSSGIPLDEFDAQNAAALSYQNQEIDIYNASWEIDSSLFKPGELTTNAIKDSIANGRGGLGNIFIFSAGNDGENNGNVNYNGLANSRYTIAVGAIDHNGVKSTYSNPGASLLVSTHTNGDDEGLTTTDLLDDAGYNDQSSSGLDLDYTQGFSGTSASSPVVSGVVALMLEANPNLTWRDVQHILVETAQQNDPTDTGWSQNGAGYLVNHQYGFGAVDASAAVNLAQTWETVTPEVSASSEVIEVNATIPDNNPAGVTSTVNLTENIETEWVEIIASPDLIKSDLDLVLTSPDGTKSLLSQQGLASSSDEEWVFTSARHWGESSGGEWTLSVIDRKDSSLETTWDSSWQIKVYGTSLDSTRSSGEQDDNVYRFFDSISGAHLYTASETERNYIQDNLANYTFEGAVYEVGNSEIGGDSLAPVYRFYNQQNGTYLYTIDETEKESIQNNLTNYSFEGELFSAYTSEVEGSIPVYRFYNSQLGTHFYTASAGEKETVASELPDYQYEDIAYYVLPVETV
jgi:subtilisin-like proprotein convertase family protein